MPKKKLNILISVLDNKLRGRGLESPFETLKAKNLIEGQFLPHLHTKATIIILEDKGVYYSYLVSQTYIKFYQQACNDLLSFFIEQLRLEWYSSAILFGHYYYVLHCYHHSH